MFYDGPRKCFLAIGIDYASHFAELINKTTAWSGVETWNTPLTMFAWATSEDVGKLHAFAESAWI